MKRRLVRSVFAVLDRHCSVAGSAVVVLTFGMLLWGRLLMTQDIPHTALARPEREVVAAARPVNPFRETVVTELHTTTDRDLFAVRVDLYESE